jgi:pSer/pThr/pTyr-binding forkhead associated (FHA) protein
MGRAPNSGAPQRVSAHVVPKAPSFSAEDEDDKTTIESGWEEEASTTVEQGDVAEKIRALALGEPKRRSGTNITSTDGGELPDEPTVDDQRANATLARLPPPAVATLVITAGNDAGQTLEVRPGKTYTIGRGVDNDLVLTDIAVSRKHFDIRHDNGAWVLADRGSGNGTLVNARIEDAPFMLASGDVIEIGNTAFRFDLPNGVPRTPVSYPPPDGDDELEMSTVSGKPYRELESSTPPETASPVARPKTLPPPSPRPRSPTARPPTAGYTIDRPGARISQSIAAQQTQPPLPMSALGPIAPALLPLGPLSPLSPLSALPGPHTLHLPQPSTTMPLPQMANRPPLPGLSPSGLLDASAGALPSTIPGGQAAPLQGRPPRLPFSSYPPGTAEIPTQRAPTATRQPMLPMLQSAGLQPSRDLLPTAQVSPLAHANGQAARIPPQGYGQAPPISRQAKMVLAGVGLAVFAAVATIAIIKGARGVIDPKVPTPAPATKPSSEPIDPKPPKATAIVPKPSKPATPPTTTTAPPTTTTAPPTTTTTPPTTTTAPPTTTTAPPTTTPQVAVTVPRVAPATTPPTPTAPPTTAPPPSRPPVAPPVATTTPPTTTPPTPARSPVAPPIAPPTPTAPPTTALQVATIHTEPVDKKPAVPKHPDKKPEHKPARPEVAVVDNTDKPDPLPKKHGHTVQDVKSDANSLYRAKNFGGAAALITAALPSFSGGDAQELRSIAAIYSQLGKAYNIGTAPGTKPTEAYQALRRATSYDHDVGSAYVAELQEHLVTVATRAAVSYMASKEYEAAFQAVRTSESLGSSSSSNKTVRDRLEAFAAEIFRSAQSDLTSDPEGAKKKLRQILGMVDPKHPLYGKAQKLLNGL